MKKILFFAYSVVLIVIVSIGNSFPQVFINQAGYINNLPKYFFTNSEADSFYIIETSTSLVVYRNELSFYVSNDAATGMTLYRGDFSDLTQDGNYFVLLSNNDSSYTFNVSKNALEDAYKKSLKGFYFQRCGITLEQDYAGVYNHPACHLADAYFHSTTGETGQKEATGGWHDAGDYGKYVVNAGITVGTLLMAYEMFPGKFSQDNLNIPESQNGIPDILDEVRFELEWLLKMQNESGGVYFKVTREQFAPIIQPQNDTGTRYIYIISSTATGDFAAMMARASRIYKDIDTSFANKCLSASILAWNYLSAHPSIIPAGGFKNPSGTATGEYGDGNDSDERLWAAAELFNSTGELTYKNYFESHYSSGGIINSTMGWPNVNDLAQLTYLTSIQATASSTIKAQIKNALVSYSNSLVNRSASNGFGVAINPGEYNWGSNSDVLNKAILLIYAYEQTKNSNYFDIALSQLNYILGVNAHNFSFITGVGTNSVLHPHHRPSWSDNIAVPVPGLMAGGPNQYLNDDVLQNTFNSSTPPALCYVDIADSYASNEICINWNAPLVFVLGYFNGEGITSVNEQGSLTFPQFYKLEQNFPNPFNPSTKIRYTVSTKQTVLSTNYGNTNGVFVTLKIYDLLGNEIVTLINEEEAPGFYEVEFNPANTVRNPSSGIYFYQIKMDGFTQTKKMVYLK